MNANKEEYKPGRLVWAAVFALAVMVRLFVIPMPESSKFYALLPGSAAILYIGWFEGPLEASLGRTVNELLMILANALAYYSLIRLVLFVRRVANRNPEEA